MSRRVRRKVVRKGEQKVHFTESDDNLKFYNSEILDWTKLPDDTVIQLFSCLNNRDRASLSSTCRTWWILGKSPCLWHILDLRPHKCNASATTSLSNRCKNLRKLRFHGADSADAIINLQAKNLREITGDGCRKMTDSTLSVLAARHQWLECLQIGPDFCERISSDAVKAIALCCPNLKKLWISGIHEVGADAINTLAKNCSNLTDIGFVDCRKVDEIALGNITSLCYLSVAGTASIKWNLARQWSKLINLIGLDVSRTDITPTTVSRLFSSSLKVICALNCPALEGDNTFRAISNCNIHYGEVLLSNFTDIHKGIATLLVDMTKSGTKDFVNWLEWIISNTLLRVAKSNPPGLDDFWMNQGTKLLLSFVQSTNEEVQERAAAALATFVVTDDENHGIDHKRADTVMRDGGIHILLKIARSLGEGLQAKAAKVIANLSVSANVAKAVAEEGGIGLFANLARSANQMVAKEAAEGLYNLSIGDEHEVAIAGSGGVQALVDLIFRFSKINGGESVLERAAGALANLAADNKCSLVVASAGGIHALVTLASCKVEGVQEQTARALANLASHGEINNNNEAVWREAGSIDALVQLIQSPHENVRQEAAWALWILSSDDINRVAIAAAGGVEALVSLVRSSTNTSRCLQERVAGALCGLSVSEANSIAIGREGGVAALITMAQSEDPDVHEPAVGALSNLALNPGNALLIVEGGGVPVLFNLWSSQSKMARFMAALAMAYMFDGRMDKIALVGTSPEASKTVNLEGARRMALKSIEAFVKSHINAQAFSAAAAASSAPAALAQVTKSALIDECGHLRCSAPTIVRFVAMLQNPCPTLKSCAAFALFQFTVPGGSYSVHHMSLLQNAGASRTLRATAEAANSPLEAKIFTRIVLWNLEQHQVQIQG